MQHSDFFEIVHHYLLQYPNPTSPCVLAIFCTCLFSAVFLMAGVIVTIKSEDNVEFFFLGGLLSLLTIFTLVYFDVPRKMTALLYPGETAKKNEAYVANEMKFVRKCHESQCMIAPGIQGGLGMDLKDIGNKEVYALIKSLSYDTSESYYGYEFVSGKNIFLDEKRLHQDFSYRVRFQSVAMRGNKAMLFVEVEHISDEDGVTKGKGIYEVPLYVALMNLREHRLAGELSERKHARETEYQNSIGR